MITVLESTIIASVFSVVCFIGGLWTATKSEREKLEITRLKMRIKIAERMKKESIAMTADILAIIDEEIVK